MTIARRSWLVIPTLSADGASRTMALVRGALDRREVDGWDTVRSYDPAKVRVEERSL